MTKTSEIVEAEILSGQSCGWSRKLLAPKPLLWCHRVGWENKWIEEKKKREGRLFRIHSGFPSVLLGSVEHPTKQRPSLTYAISKGVVNDGTLGSASQTTKWLQKGIRSSWTWLAKLKPKLRPSRVQKLKVSSGPAKPDPGATVASPHQYLLI